jgi:hypothetical protein
MQRDGVFAALALIACTGVAAPAAEAAYEFEKLAETGPTHEALGVPAVNDAGVVAFTAAAPGGNPLPHPTVSVYAGTPQAIQKVQATELRGVVTRPVDINNSGQIVFFNGKDVYRFDPGGTATRVGGNAASMGGPAIDDVGRFSYVGYIEPAGGGLAISEGSTSVNSAGPFLNVYGAHRNNEGLTLATYPLGIFYGGHGNHRIIFGAPPGTSYTDPDTGVTATLFVASDADAGDGDRAVFSGRHGDVQSLYVWDNGTVSKVPGSSEAGRTSDVPAINDLGHVAALLTGRLSVFDAAGEQRVMSVGDAFDGSTVSGLAFNAEGWNDLGQLAFTATLADGRSVNVLATVPEPGSAGVLAMVAGVAMLRRRRMARRSAE